MGGDLQRHLIVQKFANDLTRTARSWVTAKGLIRDPLLDHGRPRQGAQVFSRQEPWREEAWSQAIAIKEPLQIRSESSRL